MAHVAATLVPGLGRAARLGEHRRELWGGELHTTNNRMEMTAAIRALAALKRRCRVQLYTDSQYVRKRHHRVAAAMEGARLEDGRPQTGQER
jgi:ribonuclease HI